MIRVGVVGFGLSASVFHLPLLEASNDFKVCALSSSQAERVAASYPDLELYQQADELIRSANVDLIVITAPNEAHFPLARLTLEEGKHVVLEKPMATSAREADELNLIAKSNKRLLSVFHNRRWDGDFLTVKKLIDEKRLGDIRYFESHFDRYRPEVKKRWKELPVPGGGIWFDLGAHLVDQAIELFGMPESLTARCLSIRDNSPATDYFHVILHYGNRDVVLHSSPLCAGPNMRFHIQGSCGSYIKYGLDPQETQLKGGVNPKSTEFGLEAEEYFGTLYQGNGRELITTCKGQYAAYYSGLANGINKGVDLPVTGESSANVVRLLELAELSSLRGERLSVSD